MVVVASTELQPCAMLAKGPPCMKAGVPRASAPGWAQRLLEQRGHGAVRLEIAGAHRLAVAGIADDDVGRAAS